MSPSDAAACGRFSLSSARLRHTARMISNGCSPIRTARFRVVSLGLAALAGVACLAPSASAADALPPGKGHDLVQRTCSSCHSVGVITSQRHDADGWDQIVGVMVQRGAKATDDEQDQIVDYLAANFGAKTAQVPPAVKASQAKPAKSAGSVAPKRARGAGS